MVKFCLRFVWPTRLRSAALAEQVTTKTVCQLNDSTNLSHRLEGQKKVRWTKGGQKQNKGGTTSGQYIKHILIFDFKTG